jgi:hypothetical protein
VRVTAAHHPLAERLVVVVRRKRHEGEAYLVIEGPDGGRQLLPARHAGPAGIVPVTAALPLRFTPGSLRALAELAGSLRGAPSPGPEAHHAPQSELAVPAVAAVGQLSARDTPASGRALERPHAPASRGSPGRSARARDALR